MQGGDVDAYVTLFEKLARQAGYRLDSALTIDFFTNGLPRGLYEACYQFDEPQTYAEWKNVVLNRQEKYIHMKAHLDQRSAGRSNNDTWIPRIPGGFRRTNNPNAMDTSAGRTRGRLAEAEEVLEQYERQNKPRNPPFTPRQGFIQRGNRCDFREVTCYNCQKKGHISRQCTAPRQSRGRYVEAYEDEEPRVAATSNRPITAQERANQFITGVSKDTDEVKDIVFKKLWEEGFPSA